MSSNYNFENLVEMQESKCLEFKDRKLFGTKHGKEFSWMTFGEFATEVDKCRSIFASHKIGINDKVWCAVLPPLPHDKCTTGGSHQ
jgi:hypothetical protein